MRINLERLCRRLDYQFNNSAYLQQALTHRSVGSSNYERFEFLGDSILSFVIAGALFNLFPQQSEGQLSKLRAYLVSGDMLSEIAKELSLGDFLFLGQGELKSGGHRRASILADALEAIFAAVFLDGGFEPAKQLILKLYESRFKDPNLLDPLTDAKTQLQEYLQANKKPLPEYALTAIKGDEHDQVFYASCCVEGMKKTVEGKGVTRKKAEQDAARVFLKWLRESY